MAKCFFCSKDIEPGRGVIFVTMEGKLLHFCSSKCRKAFNLGRKKQKWVRKQKQ